MDNTMEKIAGTYNFYKYDERTWFISTMAGSMHMYLLEGDDKALLIDTGYGLGNLKEVVERMTHKPIIAANTHGHLDHSGGNGFFTEAYMHENAAVDMPREGEAMLDLNTLPHPDYTRHFVGEGDVIRLGGRDIDVYEISAHSNSSLAFLDKSHRLLFTGDEVESSQVLLFPLTGDKPSDYDFYGRCMAHKRHMEKLIALEPFFDFVAPGHNGTPISKEYLHDFLELDNRLLAKTAALSDKLNHPVFEQGENGKYLKRAIYGNASFFVDTRYL